MGNRELTDIEIVDLFKTGKQQEAFKMLINKHKERLYWHVRKIVLTHHDADDALQNCFIKIWQNLNGFKGDAALFTWLYRIATNEALTILKKKKRGNHYSIDNEDHNYIDALQSDPYFDGNQLQLKLQQAIATLPEKQKTVFNLKYFEEMKYQEIAEITETSIGALKASYHIAAKKIEAILKGSLDEQIN